MMLEESYDLILLIPISQLLKFVGFDSAELSSLNLLAEIFKAFVTQIGESSHQHAEMAGRTESNFHDIRLAFLDSGVAMENLIKFLNKFSIVPELDEIPGLDVKALGLDPSISYYEKPMPAYIPQFLPCFSNPRKSPLYNKIETNPKKLKELKAQIEAQAENNIANLRQYISTNQDIVNYDQVNDPKIAQNQSLLFKPAKDSLELINSMKDEDAVYSIPVTSIPKERLLRYFGTVMDYVDEFSTVPQQLNGTDYHNPTVTKILSLKHKEGILTLLNA